MIEVRPLQEPVERLLDQHLGRAVDVRGGLVEDEDPRVGEQRPRDRDQLPLAGRQAGAALAHRVVEAAREPRRHPVDADRGGRGLDLLVRRVRLREADVRRDRAAEEERVLQHDAELAPVRAELDVAQVVPVDAHRALVGVVEAADQPRERRLAVARLADEREAAARRDAERDPVQHRVLAVREDDASRSSRSPSRRGSGCAPGRSWMSRLLVEDGRDLHHRGAGRLQLPVDVGELLQRLEDELQQVDRRDQRPDRERVVLDTGASRRRGPRPSRARRGTRSTGRRPRRSSGRRSTARGSRR